MKKNYKFTSDWISGFTQSDGSFVISCDRRKKGIPVRPQPIFNLTQSISEYDMFVALQKHLGVGRVHKNRNNVTFVVTSIDDLIKVIIPIFDNCPLRSSKQLSFQIFKLVCFMMQEKKHLTLAGTLIILELSYFMNKDTSLRTAATKAALIQELAIYAVKSGVKLPNISELKLPLLDETKPTVPLNKEFVRGLVDGDGSFNISFRTNRRRIVANFTVVHEISSIAALNELAEFFGCGAVYKLPSQAARYQVENLSDILAKVLPVFNQMEFNTIKQNHFEIFSEVCRLLVTNGYKSDKDLQHIVDLAWNMNKGGKTRRITKVEYLAKFTSLVKN